MILPSYKKPTIRKMIREVRRNLGLNQAKFANKFKVTANTVSRWESGTYEVPNKVIEQILHTENVSIMCPLCKGYGTITKFNL